MNIHSSAAEIGISLEAYKRICSLFIENTDKDLLQLKSELEMNNLTQSAATAHHIKGAAANMDYTDLAALAKKLQLLLQTGTAPSDELSKQYEQLSRGYQNIKEEILSQL
ncbi:MAG: Hpt domain-containing protein [Spirochaetia bacterium]|nr:Hpt domain-containing protein [Spirochaetia bacterium]